MSETYREMYKRSLKIKINLLPEAEVRNGIMKLPDGDKWRIEGKKTVKDVVSIGDIIETNYSTGGRVVGIHRIETCPCPLRNISRTRLCYDSWDPPKKNNKYHQPVFYWTITFVDLKANQNKDGSWRDTDLHWINELVFFDGMIRKLFLANKDTVTLTGQHMKLKIPVQLQLGL